MANLQEKKRLQDSVESILLLYRDKIEPIVDSDIESIPLIISKKDLSPWEMACCWIEEDRAKIQLHPALLSESRSLWAINPYLVILHEYVHAVRAPLHSVQYEEYIAYTVSRFASSSYKDTLRCFLGPIFESQFEISFFFIFYFASLFFLTLFDQNVLLSLSIWTPFLVRLIWKNQKISRLYSLLLEEIGEAQKAISLLIQLDDADINEILKMAKDGFFSIRSYKIGNVRWDQIRKKYGAAS